LEVLWGVVAAIILVLRLPYGILSFPHFLEKAAIVVIARMVPKALTSFGVVIKNLATRRLARPPMCWQWSFQAIASYPQEISIFFQIHAKPFSIVLNVSLCGFVVLVCGIVQNDNLCWIAFGFSSLSARRLRTFPRFLPLLVLPLASWSIIDFRIVTEAQQFSKRDFIIYL
jgi:hypothetical protein